MPIDERRLQEISNATIGPLSDLAMWSTWQDLVKCNLGDGDPQVAKNHLFVRQESPNDVDYEKVAKLAFDIPLHEAVKKFQSLDGNYGALMIPTSFGVVNRMWLDAIIETDFISRHCDDYSRILEIGAGYGRLALLLPEMLRVTSYDCVDAVPISTYLCEWYLAQNNGKARVITPDKVTQLRASLSINIHSWSECSKDQVARWLDVIDAIGADWLFTKPHQKEFYCWGGNEFRSLIEERFEPVAEEELGFGNVLHVMWKRRKAQ
jgi:putative sugar O-methyltransferase